MSKSVTEEYSVPYSFSLQEAKHPDGFQNMLVKETNIFSNPRSGLSPWASIIWHGLYLVNLVSCFFISLLFLCLTKQMNEHVNGYKTFVRAVWSRAAPKGLLTFPRP